MDQDATTLILVLVSVCWIAGQGDTPACQEDLTGVNYRGNLSQTIKNHTCQAWTSQDPHQHDRTPANYPNAGLDDNYCRNPDDEDTAWCYTTDPGIRWELCAVGFLDPRCQATTEPTTNPTTPTPVQSETVTSQTTVDTPACQEDPTGLNYRGNLSQTINNHTCQAWTSQDPHQHDRTPADYPNAGLDDNYCRNPDDEDTAWCYTTDPEIRWELCAVGFLDPRCQATAEPTTNPTTPTPVQSETITSQTTVGPIQDASPLGLESGVIPDSSLTASSEWDTDHSPSRGRLNIARIGLLRGGWSAKINDLNQWIQVDLLETYNIVGVATQGRQDFSQWVTNFKIACSIDSTTFDTVKDPTNTDNDNIFPGNSDQNTVVYNRLPVPMTCRYVRLLPSTWYAHISLRMELFGELLVSTEASTIMDTTMEELQTTAGETTVYLETTQSDQGTTRKASTASKTPREGTVAMTASTRRTPPQLQGLLRVLADLNEAEAVTFGISMPMILYFTFLMLALLLRCIVIWIRGLNKKEVKPDQKRPQRMYELVKI